MVDEQHVVGYHRINLFRIAGSNNAARSVNCAESAVGDSLTGFINQQIPDNIRLRNAVEQSGNRRQRTTISDTTRSSGAS